MIVIETIVGVLLISVVIAITADTFNECDKYASFPEWEIVRLITLGIPVAFAVGVLIAEYSTPAPTTFVIPFAG